MTGTVAIVGGGLTGLALASRLHEAGREFRLFEGRDRLGGRINTAHVGAQWFDLGPSWFWPGQPRMAALVQQLGLEVFPQYAEGAQIYETAQGAVIRDRGFASMQGSLRVRGGMGAIVQRLSEQLPESRVKTGRVARSVSGDCTLGFADGDEQGFDQVVLAVPPRVAAELEFTPDLSASKLLTLRDIPTWMAGHAKFVAVYDTAFWREDGLSGDASSQRGPLAEIHDASADTGGALFGFLGVPATARAGQRDAVIAASVAQLVRLFGPRAASPAEVFYTDWSEEPLTAVSADRAPLTHHPAYGRPQALMPAPDSRILFAATELASEMGGYLEGALAAADEAAAWVLAGSAP
ncbi:FAD-dependent oxidoreductase [Marivita sp.]|uniref:flavin monoamine oxidase family protein n=1 Tax=Marivita sp. TaxID=2003365 RepID=UPI00260F7A1C|nr:FAD-dependent oxidoreductase [Marivita sp.]